MTPASSRPICARPRARRSRPWWSIPAALPRLPNRHGRQAMGAIEPNWIALLWFALFATVCAIAFLVVSGMFPFASRPERVKSGAATALVVGNGLLLMALLAGTGLYGYAELRWTTLIVVTGLVVLFAPGLFEVWPSSMRDGPTGLVVLIGIQILALATLAKLARPPWANMS